MGKKFTTNFDDLISDTTNASNTDLKETGTKDFSGISQKTYSRITVAIHSKNLQKLKMICLIKQTKMRDILNNLIDSFISQNDIDLKM